MMTRCVVCGLYGGSEWYQDGLNVVDKLMIVDIVDERTRIGILSKYERSMLVEEWMEWGTIEEECETVGRKEMLFTRRE